MGKQLVIVIMGVVAIAFSGCYEYICREPKAPIEAEQKPAFEENQVSQEIACDECSATTTGLKIAEETGQELP